MRVTLDTNILISSMIFKSKIMKELIYYLSIEHEIIIASYCIDEIKGICKTKFKVNIKEIDDFFEGFPFELVYSPSVVKTNCLK